MNQKNIVIRLSLHMRNTVRRGSENRTKTNDLSKLNKITGHFTMRLTVIKSREMIIVSSVHVRNAVSSQYPTAPRFRSSLRLPAFD
jgi:hypothetical protein